MSTGLRAGMALLALFLASVVAGYYANFGYLDEALRQLQETAKETGFNPASIALTILIKNTVVATITILSGVLVVPPILILVNNGFFIGYTVHWAMVNKGSDPLFLASLLLPHGVLEIPVLILATYSGLRVAGSVIDKLRHREASISARLAAELGKLKVIIPLLVVSALVEALVTPLVGMLVARMLGIA